MERSIIVKLALMCCLSMFFYNCDNTVQTIDAKYVIDVDKAEEKGVFYLSEIIKNVRPIRLEETDYSWIGEIDLIQVFDGNIFVLDMLIAKKLFVYDMNGKYIRQIGSLGHGPDEYQGISSFCIDPDRKEIYLLDYWKTRLLKYRIKDGKLLDKIDLPRCISYSGIAHVEGNIYACITHDNPKENKNLLFKIDLKTGKYEEYLSSEIFNAGWSRNISDGFIQSNLLKYRGAYTNTVFSCTKDSVYPYMAVKSKDWVRNGDLPVADEDYMYNEDIRLREKGRAFTIGKYFENDSCIHFQYYHGKNTCHIAYNKQTHDTYRYHPTVNDIVSNTGDYPIYNFFSMNSKFAYDLMYTNVVLSFLKEGRLSSDLAKQVESLTLDEEGYVIMEYEFK